MINNIENGGLKLTGFETFIKSLRLVWITRALNDNPAPWKAYLEYLLRLPYSLSSYQPLTLF